MSKPSPRQPGELSALFKEVVALYLRLTADASAIHGLGELSGPRRTVLTALAGSGPQTVARLARSRAQARQRVQPLVNALIEEGLVEALPNPMHQRSPLIVLTAAGQQRAREMLKAEMVLLAKLRLAASPRELARAAGVLRDVRETLERQLPALLTARRRGVTG